MKIPLPKVTAFEQRARQICEETGIPLVPLYNGSHSLQDWKHILVRVEMLTGNLGLNK